MKVKNVFVFFIIIPLFISYHLNAQDSLKKDPLLKFKNFYEVGISVSGSRVNTNYTQFTTLNGTYSFKKNSYSPSFSAGFNYGWLFKTKSVEPHILKLKTGLNLLNRSANLTDSVGSNYRLSTGLLQIPIEFGFRVPLNHHTVKNDFFRAIEINAGVYFATPFIQKLDHPNNIDSKVKNVFADYIKFGFTGEIAFTSLNKNGKGNKFGICASIDYLGLIKMKETPSQLYPYYYTIGIFYVILNKYH